MANVDIDPFGEHDKTDKHPDEMISFNLMGSQTGSSQEPMSEISLGSGKTQRTRLMESHVEDVYKRLSEVTCQDPGAICLNSETVLPRQEGTINM